MPSSLRPACGERTADDEGQVATNRAQRAARRSEIRQRAPDATDDQARERHNAGQPGTTNAALPTRSQDVKHAKHREEKMLCRLTLELSGGEAVRLERVVRVAHG